MTETGYRSRARRSRHFRTLGWVYFIGAAGTAPVKVGWAQSPASRLVTLQIAHWETLRVLGQVRGTGAVEAEIHAALAAHHVRGEWFERGPALAMYEQLLAAESPYLDKTGRSLVAENAGSGAA